MRDAGSTQAAAQGSPGAPGFSSPSAPTPIAPGSGGGGRRPLGSTTKYLIGCGGCAVVAVLALAVGGFLVVSLGLGVFVDQVEAELRDNPVVVEHLGRIESFELEVMASMAAPGPDDFVFRAEGTKGTGLIQATCITIDDVTEEVVAGTLQLSSGETLDLFQGDEQLLEADGT